MDAFWQEAKPHTKKKSFSKRFKHFWTKKIFYIFFIKSFQIWMKDTESAESKEKSNFRFFQFLFFKLWSFLWHHHPNFQWIFHNLKNFKNVDLFFILFSTLHIIHKNWIKTDGGGVCISLVGKRPRVQHRD